MENQELEACIHEYGKAVYSFCRQLAGSRQEADDLYQDTFLKAMELSGKIEYDRNPKSYLLSIALRIWKNRRRKFAWRQRIAGTCALTEEAVKGCVEEQAYSAEDAVLKQELEEQVKQAVKELSDKYRIPVYLYYTLQLSMEEISNVMRIPTGTVKSRLHKARSLLKKKLEVVYDEI